MVTQVTNPGRSGLQDWLVQRFTAVVLLAYMVFIIGYLLSHDGMDFQQWQALFDCTLTKAFTMLAVVSIVWHAWIGLWAVSTDYMTTRLMGGKATALRLVFQAGYSVILFFYLVWGIQILWG